MSQMSARTELGEARCECASTDFDGEAATNEDQAGYTSGKAQTPEESTMSQQTPDSSPLPVSFPRRIVEGPTRTSLTPLSKLAESNRPLSSNSSTTVSRSPRASPQPRGPSPHQTPSVARSPALSPRAPALSPRGLSPPHRTVSSASCSNRCSYPRTSSEKAAQFV